MGSCGNASCDAWYCTKSELICGTWRGLITTTRASGCRLTSLPRADNSIADANVRAETLLNMARSAIIGSDVARTIRIAEAGARFDIWHSNKAVAAYDIKVHAGRTAEMEVDLMIAPIVDHDGWRVVSVHAQSQARKIGHRGSAGGARSAIVR